MRITVRPDDMMPMYAQIVHQIRLAILSGELRVGDQLPTVRELAVELSVNTNTVGRAYMELHRAGLIDTKQGVGTFVKDISSSVSDRARQERLRGLARTALHEAAAIGFRSDQLIEAIAQEASEEGR
ncbi:MAG: GntR family transcriptional regulator [Fimbriimonadales bacterium]